ncbi:MAG: O-antigen ligase family protein [Thermotogae bacterium]|nr:O-antigen ligase family protein [Thermotogota bacterium]
MGITFFEEVTLFFMALIVPILAIPSVTYEFTTQKYAITTLLFSILMIYRAYLMMAGKVKEDRKIRVPMPLIGWFAFCIASYLSLIGAFKMSPYYMREPFEVATYVTFVGLTAFYLINTVNKKTTMTIIAGAFVGSGMFIAVDALYNFYAGKDIWLGKLGSPYNRSLMKATIGNPNFVSDYMAIIAPIAVYFAAVFGKELLVYFKSKDEHKKQKKDNDKMGFWLVISIKCFAVLAYTLMIITIMLCETRATYISVMLSWTFFAISLAYWYRFSHVKKKEEQEDKSLRKTNRIAVYVLIAVTIITTIVYSTNNPLTKGKVNVVKRASTLTGTIKGGTGSQRLLAWWSSIYQFKDSPIVGTGIGTYKVHTITYLGKVQADKPKYIYSWKNFKRTHNDYLQVLGETGIIGFISIVFTLLTLIIYYFSILKRIKDKDDLLFFILLAVGAAATMLHSAVSFPMHLTPNNLAATFILSFILCGYYNKEMKYTFENFPMKNIGIAVFFVFVSFGIVTNYLKWTSFASEVNFRWGNIDYQYKKAYSKAVTNFSSELKKVKAMQNDLKEYKGQFLSLKPEIFTAKKLNEARQKAASMGVTLSKVRENNILLEAAKERDREESNIRMKLQSDLNKISNFAKQYDNKAYAYFCEARKRFLKSISYDRNYGKSYFYISLIAEDEMRQREFVAGLNNVLKSSDKDKIIAYILDSFDDSKDKYHLFAYMCPKYRNKRYIADLSLLSRVIQSSSSPAQVIKDFRVVDLHQLKIFTDTIDYFETSFLYFNEKNSYRILGKLFYNTIGYHRFTSGVYARLVSRYPKYANELKQLSNEHMKYAKESKDSFVNWYDKALYVMPGWTHYKDWYPIYNEYMRLLIIAGDFYPDLYPKVLEVARKRIWVGRVTHVKYDTLEDVMNNCAALGQKFLDAHKYSEAYYVTNELVHMVADNLKELRKGKKEIGKEIGEINLEQNNSNPDELKQLLKRKEYLSNTLNKIEKFEEQFNKVVKVEEELINDLLLKVTVIENDLKKYKNTEAGLSNEQKLKIEEEKGVLNFYIQDWSANELTKEKVKDLTVEKLLKELNIYKGKIDEFKKKMQI